MRSIRGWRQNGWSAGSGSSRDHVQRGVGELAGVERVEQVRLDQVAAAADVDEAGAARQPGEQAGVQDALGLGGERQQADQDVEVGEEGVELSAPA